MSFCPESKKRAAMTDSEFWAYVFSPTPEETASWEDYDWAMNSPDIWTISCARCGRIVEVDDPASRERDAFCDDCADELIPDSEDIL